MENGFKVIIADDHPIVRKGLKEIVEEIRGVLSVDEAEDGFILIDKVAENDYDLIILDVSMPGINGLDTLYQLQLLKKTFKVIVFSIYSEDQYAIRFLKAGASGYITKDRDASDIIDAIQTVMNDGRYFSKDILEKFVLAKVSGFNDTPHEMLSNREYEIMLMLASGNKSSDIAIDLSISEKTVGTHKIRIFNKMNLQNMSELIHYAVEKNLI